MHRSVYLSPRWLIKARNKQILLYPIRKKFIRLDAESFLQNEQLTIVSRTLASFDFSQCTTIGGGSQTCTFTTKNGKTYLNAKATVTDTGLSVLTSDGGTTIPFDQLPDDLSGFSVSMRKLIADKRQVLITQSNNTALRSPNNEAPGPGEAVSSDQLPLSDVLNSPIKKDPFPNATAPSEQTVEETVRFINEKIIGQGYYLSYNKASDKYILGPVTGNRAANNVFPGRYVVSGMHPIFQFRPNDLNPDNITFESPPDDPRGFPYTLNKFADHYLLFNSKDGKDCIYVFPSRFYAPESQSSYYHNMAMPVLDEAEGTSISNAMSHLVDLYGGQTDSDLSTISNPDIQAYDISKKYPPPMSGTQQDVSRLVAFINLELAKDQVIRRGIIYDDQKKSFALARGSFSPPNEELCFMPGEFNPSNMETCTNGNQYGIRLHTTGASSVRHILNDEQGGHDMVLSDSHSLLIYLPTKEDAQQFGQAFIQLINLYGGKPEEF